MAITTAMCTSFKRDLMSALHCFNGVVTPTGDTNTSFIITSMSSLVGVAVGMAISGTDIPASTVIASIDSASQITISKAATGTTGSVSLTITGDAFKIALFKASVSGTFGAATTNYTEMSTDETSGTGYSAGGEALVNVSPAISGTTAFVDFSPDPSWTSASFSTDGALIYNNSRRGPTATLATSTHDFGGTQTVSSGTFTAVMPTADASNAILRLA